MIEVIEHALDWLKHDGTLAEFMVLLQPTQPLRDPADVVRAVQTLQANDCHSVVSVVELPAHMSPDYVMRIDADGRLVNFLPEGYRVTRRQDARRAYTRDGTVYAFRTATVREHRSPYGPLCLPLVLDAQRSINIDTQADWEDAERRLGCR
jgi:CMP-N-acetylneuraminic acid synthetase